MGDSERERVSFKIFCTLHQHLLQDSKSYMLESKATILEWVLNEKILLYFSSLFINTAFPEGENLLHFPQLLPPLLALATISTFLPWIYICIYFFKAECQNKISPLVSNLHIAMKWTNLICTVALPLAVSATHHPL